MSSAAAVNTGMWSVRHEGSPSSLPGLTLADVLAGLQDGRWEPTDEVMGPTDSDWVPIESHPQLEEAAAELEPPPPRVYDDETRLDFNPLIDVCLVLLVFFILTTSYAVLQKRLEAPGVSANKAGPAIVTKERVDKQMIKVSVVMEGGRPVTKVEDKVIDPSRLLAELKSYTKASGKTELLLEHDDDVPERDVVVVLDAAKGADIQKIYLVIPEKKK
jgi:biopolymer transport protein ExbD